MAEDDLPPLDQAFWDVYMEDPISTVQSATLDTTMLTGGSTHTSSVQQAGNFSSSTPLDFQFLVTPPALYMPPLLPSQIRQTALQEHSTVTSSNQWSTDTTAPSQYQKGHSQKLTKALEDVLLSLATPNNRWHSERVDADGSDIDASGSSMNEWSRDTFDDFTERNLDKMKPGYSIYLFGANTQTPKVYGTRHMEDGATISHCEAWEVLQGESRNHGSSPFFMSFRTITGIVKTRLHPRSVRFVEATTLEEGPHDVETARFVDRLLKAILPATDKRFVAGDVSEGSAWMRAIQARSTPSDRRRRFHGILLENYY